jgi:23S rRNA-/tRNA-specific pseudouridylate synthase
VIDEYSLVASEHDTLEVFACNKPSSVPVHPAGPYLSNSLTMMVEAQEGLKPRALIPCHRIDRATSGLTIFCTNVCIARILQTSIDEGRVRKLYMARVIGLFPSTTAECIGFKNIEFHKLASIDFLEDCLEINAPVLTNDPSTGIRIVSKIGKPSKSRFRFLDYDHKSNTSLILCYPMTGRGHQLRLHLQFLGYPIVDDVQYGGFSESTSNMKRSLELMCKPVSIKSKGTVSSDLVSPTEASFAIDICRCCKQGELGVTESFTKSQLLDSGHSISLHALKYEIAIPRKRKLKGCEVGPDNIAHLQLSIALPSWGSNIDVTRLNWLKER